MTTAITKQDFPEIRWHGHWIWVGQEKLHASMGLPGEEQRSKNDATGLFRKAFHLTQVPARAPTRITADARYVLYINGREVSRGPARSQPRRMMYDLFDLAPFLRAGENIIALRVCFYGHANAFYMPVAPNAILGKTGAVVFEANLGAAGWLVSDATWKSHKSEAWDHDTPLEGSHINQGVPVEYFDARKIDPRWMMQDFDDQTWPPAQLLRAVHIGGFAHSQPPTDPYGPLYPRPIAALHGHSVTPSRVTIDTLALAPDAKIQAPAKRMIASMTAPTNAAQADAPIHFPITLAPGHTRTRIDFGRIVAGLVQLHVSAPAGTEIYLAYTEDSLTGKEQGFLAPNNGSRYIVRGSHDEFEAFDIQGLRYIYLLTHSKQPIQINKLAVRETLYPWVEGASFECDDAQLNKLFTAGIRTVRLNSHDAFIDCPTREQRAWVGDSVVHQMVHLATNQDWRLAWHYLNLSDSPRPDGILPMSVSGEIEYNQSYTIPDWSLHWVHGVYNLYRFTGDKDSTKAFMPSIERVLRWYAPFQTLAGVLKDVTEWNLVDWSALYVEDTSSILTALWSRGLKEFAEMAAWLEERASERWATQLYEKAKAGFEIFWDEARGTYVDHIKEGVRQKPISQVAGAAAVASGLAPRERWARIMRTVTDAARLVVRSWTGQDSEYGLQKIQKQMMGIYEADWDVEREIVIGEPFISYMVHDAVVAAGLTHTLPDLYLRWNEFLANGYDTLGECWGWGTHVHGWSSCITRDMAFYTLGVTPAEPGYTKARISPKLGRLKWAKGRVPTPFGLIEVEVNGNDVKVKSPIPYEVVP